MLCADGCAHPGLECAKPPWYNPMPSEIIGITVYLDISVRSSPHAPFHRKESVRMLWLRRSFMVDVENDDWDPEAGEEEQEYNWHSDPTWFDQLAACNLSGGQPGSRPTLDQRLRDDDELLIEIKLTAQLPERQGRVVSHAFQHQHNPSSEPLVLHNRVVAPEELGMHNLLLFARIIPVQKLRALYNQGDVYAAYSDYHGTTPGYNGSVCVRLFNSFKENVPSAPELSSVPEALDELWSSPGMQYTEMKAGIEMLPDGTLVLQDVHLTFPSQSIHGGGFFDGVIDSLPLAPQEISGDEEGGVGEAAEAEEEGSEEGSDGSDQ